MKSTTRRAATLVAATALAGTTALVAAPGATAAPAPGAFSHLKITKSIKKIKLPKKITSKNTKFKVKFSGTASDGPSAYNDTNGDGAVVYYKDYSSNYKSYKVKLKKAAVKKNASKPVVLTPQSSDVSPGKNGGYKLRVGAYTTPGKYKVKVPVTQYYYPAGSSTLTKTTRWAKKKVVIKANKKHSKKATGASAPSWKVGKTAKIKLHAPLYEKGAKAKAFYKKNGSKKKIKLGKAKLKKHVKKGESRATFKTKKMTKSGKVFFKVGKRKFAPKYTSKKFKVTVRR